MVARYGGGGLDRARDGYRLSVDIGGTFTDIALLNIASSELWSGKRLTTQDPSDAVVAGIKEILAHRGVQPAQVEQVFHATTIATNALIERKGATTALVATTGFRDILEIRDEGRYDLFDLNLEIPPPLVPRERRLEVPERIAADGSVLAELDVTALDEVAEQIRSAGAEAVAVSFLHSYCNSEHEELTRDFLRARLPGVRVSISSEVAPEIREYQRTSTTVANAYVQPLLTHYLEKLQQEIGAMGIPAEILIMLSSGGACTIDAAKEFPVRLVESGPAAGAILAASSGQVVGHRSLLSFDMGGTTAKSCLIMDGTPHMAQEFETARVWRFKKGSGLPLRAPVIELVEIGAGGGSIASVNSLGTLDVGPHSAGAHPGPACYGQGGTLPTVTDADLVLGYLDEDHFLGGAMKLDRAAACAAITEHIAKPLDLDLMHAAWAIHAKVNESMAAAARMAAVELGADPSAYPLFAFGGAGPVHAYGVGRTLRVPEVIVGIGAGVGSAIGLLSAPVAFDLVRSRPALLSDTEWPAVAAMCDAMVTNGQTLVTKAGVSPDEITVQISADMRYQGQGHEIEVNAASSTITDAVAEHLLHEFGREYSNRYGHSLAAVPVEVLNWRVRVAGPAFPLSGLRPTDTLGESAASSPTFRSVYFDGLGVVQSTPVYDRHALEVGQQVSGPVIIQERESTTVVGPDASVEVHPSRSLVIRLHDVEQGM